MSEPSLAGRFSSLRTAGRAALVPYITAGYPGAAATREFLRGAEASGADVIELGVPWSDPVADGPVIQASSHAALQGGMTMAGALALLAEVRPGIPVIVFSYLNPILAFGAARFAGAAAAAGAAGVLVTDLPVDTDPGVEGEIRSSGLPIVRLVAPTSSPDRVRRIASASEGMVYLISRLGVTGNNEKASQSLQEKEKTSLIREKVQLIRAATSVPVVVGFGISEPAQAAAVAGVADGVVVGSALVERMRTGGAQAALAWLTTLRRAMDAKGTA